MIPLSSSRQHTDIESVIDEVLNEASFEALKEDRVRQFYVKGNATFKATDRGVGGLSGASLTNEGSKERIMMNLKGVKYEPCL